MYRVHLVFKDLWEVLALVEWLVAQAFQAVRGGLVPLVELVLLAVLVLQDLSDFQARQVPLVLPEHPEMLGQLEAQDRRERLALPDFMEGLVLLAQMGHLEEQEPRV